MTHDFDSAAVIAAMITPAMLILGAVSLVASALVRMARVVDRARVLIGVAREGTWDRVGATPAVVRVWLDRHARRARYAERSILLLYGAVVLFITTSLAIVLNRASQGVLDWLPVALAMAGTVLLLAGGMLMVAESRLSGEQIQDEIRDAVSHLKEERHS
jgi:Protein of unknown function (DUF2721)